MLVSLWDNKSYVTSPSTYNICITIIQCWSSVEDVGPTLDKCYTNVVCLLGLLYTRSNVSIIITKVYFCVVFIGRSVYEKRPSSSSSTAITLDTEYYLPVMLVVQN